MFSKSSTHDYLRTRIHGGGGGEGPGGRPGEGGRGTLGDGAGHEERRHREQLRGLQNVA